MQYNLNGSNPDGSNYPCLEQFSMVPKMFEPLKFDCSWKFSIFNIIDELISFYSEKKKKNYLLPPKTNISFRKNGIQKFQENMFWFQPAKRLTTLLSDSYIILYEYIKTGAW